MKLSLFVIIFIFPIYIFSQTADIDSLKDEKTRLLKAIELNNSLLSDYSVKQHSELSQLSVINEQLTSRNKLIDLYNYDVLACNKQLRILNSKIDTLEISLNNLRIEYANLISNYQLNSLYSNNLIYLLSASSINETYKRLIYLRQYKDYHLSQYNNIINVKAKYEQTKSVIQNKREELSEAIKTLEDEKQRLTNEVQRKQTLISSISDNLQQLEQQILDIQQKSELLEQRIVSLIEEERRKALLNNIDSTINFSNIKGNLPWPANNCVVVDFFGQHEHPLFPSISINNNGIDINLLGSTDVHPVLNGVVSRVIIIPGSNASIIIRHGNFLTVYSNISDVAVKKDEQVTTETILGHVFSGEGINSKILHFELWDSENKQDPLLWLKKL
ncbi:MAG: peptidoglycan DD-metalloendopeptidase family protein [Clostridia bacterium]|nr:peptidoglycan DD-metalloendopeptidase family protein [Clostridia bacterium]MCF0190628.1 peptidoglycan DD-metalloendopeptidase family protein [Marinilabiliaceae bacterium]